MRGVSIGWAPMPKRWARKNATTDNVSTIHGSRSSRPRKWVTGTWCCATSSAIQIATRSALRLRARSSVI
jgi:hypothetical protein